MTMHYVTFICQVPLARCFLFLNLRKCPSSSACACLRQEVAPSWRKSTQRRHIMNQCTSKDINVLTWLVIILIHCWKSMLSWIELPVPSVCAATFCWINWVRCSNVRQWKSNRHAKIPMDKHTQKWFQHVCKVHILIKIKTELHHLILHFIQCAFRCMASFPTHASVASDYLPRDQTVPHIGRILFCMQCIIHIWQVFLILFINFMFQAMSCCEPLGNSWGKDSKLLCSICVFRLSQGRKFHQLFKFKRI